MVAFRSPEVQFAEVGGSRIAYQTVGSGPPDFGLINPFWSL